MQPQLMHFVKKSSIPVFGCLGAYGAFIHSPILICLGWIGILFILAFNFKLYGLINMNVIEASILVSLSSAIYLSILYALSLGNPKAALLITLTTSITYLTWNLLQLGKPGNRAILFSLISGTALLFTW